MQHRNMTAQAYQQYMPHQGFSGIQTDGNAIGAGSFVGLAMIVGLALNNRQQ